MALSLSLELEPLSSSEISVGMLRTRNGFGLAALRCELVASAASRSNPSTTSRKRLIAVSGGRQPSARAEVRALASGMRAVAPGRAHGRSESIPHPHRRRIEVVLELGGPRLAGAAALVQDADAR